MEIKKEMGRLVGGRDRDRKNIRVEKRNPQNSNHSLRSQAGNRCEERGREKSPATSRWGSDVSTSRPSSPIPDSNLKLGFIKKPPQSLPAGPSLEPYPSLAHCFPSSQPLLRPHKPHGTGTVAGALLKRAGPETGSRKPEMGL